MNKTLYIICAFKTTGCSQLHTIKKYRGDSQLQIICVSKFLSNSCLRLYNAVKQRNEPSSSFSRNNCFHPERMQEYNGIQKIRVYKKSLFLDFQLGKIVPAPVNKLLNFSILNLAK